MGYPKTCKECGLNPLRISWSKLRQHKTCAQSTYLRSKGHKPAIQDIRNFLNGTVTDRAVRQFLEGDPHNNLDSMPGMVEEILDTEVRNAEEKGEIVKWRSAHDRTLVEEECKEAVTKIRPYLEKFVLPFDYEADHHFEVVLEVPHPHGGIGTIILNGYMDILVRDRQGRWAIWDVKHTKDDQYWRKTAGQISFYDYALSIREGQGAAIGGLLQPLCKEPVKQIPIDPGNRQKITADIISMARDIWRDDFALSATTKPCEWCEYKHACPRFKPVEKDGSRRVGLFSVK